MTEESESASRWGGGLEITAPVLRRSRFDWEGESDPSIEGGVFEYTLGILRINELSLGVEFAVSLTQVANLVLECRHRMTVTLKPGSPEASDPDRAFRLFAATMAPRAMYPFARETMSSLVSRAYLRGFVLPITNVGLLFDPDELEIPKSDEGEREASRERERV
jgi:hypothetical protein